MRRTSSQPRTGSAADPKRNPADANRRAAVAKRNPADAKRRADPGRPGFRIADYPFYLLARTAGRYAIDMENALRVIGVDLPSWRALMVVSETNPSSVSEIADRAVMRLSTMTRVVQRLEKRGLLTLARRKNDARVTEVYITASGRRVARQARQIASRLYHLAFHDLGTAQIATLNSLLRKVFRNLALHPEHPEHPEPPKFNSRV